MEGKKTIAGFSHEKTYRRQSGGKVRLFGWLNKE